MTAGFRNGLVVLLGGMLTLSGCAPPRATSPLTPAGAGIDTLALRAHTSFLADDLLAGRATGSVGAAIAARYIESQCRAIGLRPAGGDAAFTQAVPLDDVVPRGDATWLDIGGVRLTVMRDFLLTGGVPGALHGFRGPSAYAGTADDIRRDPAGLPDLRGAVAVVIGVARADVAALLADRGAVGIVQVVADADTYAAYAASRGGGLMTLRDTATVSSFYPRLPAVIVGPRGAAALRTPGDTVRLTAVFDRRRLEAHNVACLLPGRDPSRRDTAIVFTAHYDHLGISIPDETGDSIYNGFSDNAAGVAMLLAIGKQLATRSEGPLRHAVLLLFFTGEERGLLGSDYFVAHPTYPLGRMRAVINLDAGAPPARPWSWRLAGGDTGPLGPIARDVAAARGWSTTVSPATPNSDYFPFARMGVPAVFLVPGPAPYEGLSADSSQALRRRWDRYHQPGDAYDDAFPFTGLQRYAEYALLIAEAVDARW